MFLYIILYIILYSIHNIIIKIKNSLKKKPCWAVVSHAFNPRIQEAEVLGPELGSSEETVHALNH